MSKDIGFKDGLFMGLTFGVLLSVLMATIMFIHSDTKWRKEAVEAGVAEYQVDIEGKTSFHWRKCK